VPLSCREVVDISSGRTVSGPDHLWAPGALAFAITFSGLGKKSFTRERHTYTGTVPQDSPTTTTRYNAR
jgi:hypothetical protein